MPKKPANPKPEPKARTTAQAEKTQEHTGPTRSGTAAIVGRANVGKSTLLNAMIGVPLAITSSKPQTTRDRILGIATGKGAQIVFVDTPGMHESKTKLGTMMNREARDAARDADVILFMVDSLVPVADDIAIAKELPKNVILVLNKIDRVNDKTALFDALSAHAAVRDYLAIVPISAKSGNGVDRVLAEVRSVLPEGEMGYDDETLTDRPTRFFVAEYVREQVLKKTREEVPHGVAVVIERFDEPTKNKIGTIEAAIHVDRESHKRIVVGKGGLMLKEIGIASRRRIESLLGHRIHLKLWVRVTPGWYRTDAGLKQMGYTT